MERSCGYAAEYLSFIDPVVWQEVNAKLSAGSLTGSGATRTPQNALLAGLLLCKSCQRPMVPTYTAKPFQVVSAFPDGVSATAASKVSSKNVKVS